LGLALAIAPPREDPVTRPHLFGPVPVAFAEENFPGLRASGACLTFDFGPDGDIPVRSGDTWADLLGRCPGGWWPEFVALWLPGAVIPAAVWDAPIPIIGLAADWHLFWHAYRRVATRCDVVLANRPGVEVFRRAGFNHARPANLHGLGRHFHDHPWPGPDADRDIDVLFVGDVHPAVGPDWLPWLGRLAALAGRRFVAIRTGTAGADNRELLARAKLVFNRSVRGGCNRRVFEALAAGAVLLEEENAEVGAILRPGKEYAPYGEADLEVVIDRLLTDRDRRVALAAAGYTRAREFTFEALWAAAVESLDDDWDRLQDQAGRRPAWAPHDHLRSRAALALGSARAREDATLPEDLTRASELDGAAGWAGLQAAVAAALGSPPAAVLDPLRRAAERIPPDAAAWLSLAEALAALRDPDGVAWAARAALSVLNRSDVLTGDPAFVPPGFHLFRAEWERAAWANAGNPAAEARAKRELARWKLHSLLAQATGDLTHYHEAALARPDLPSARAALGCALAQHGRTADAISHLRLAATGDPFDRAAARALYQVLAQAGDPAAQRKFAREQHALAQAAPGLVPAEQWFATAPPAGDELASVIVLCCNEMDVTRLCLESVFRHTRQPYELVLIDNGSTDETPAYLDSLRGRQGPELVVVIRNEENRGYPAGVNQGLVSARGEYLVLLNNDVVVTPRWLDRLVACSLFDWPNIGMAGAVTNYAPPPQQVAPGYSDLAGLDAFAARHAAEFAGQATDVARLTGFCLLIRRAAYERVGAMDERFGVGFFDDDDLCLRARRAGLRLALALDCYVHHFGSRTFRALGIDTEEQLNTNLGLYRDKWGAEEANKFRPLNSLPHPAARPTGGPRPRVSLTMIVRNEERDLPACLESVRDLVNEMVIVDTGSTDRTREVAAAFGAKVFEFPWVDSFAAARNEAIKSATGEWVFWMDADDRLDEANRRRARDLFANLPDRHVAFVMKCYCLGEAPGGATTVDHVRLFRNRPDVRWKYRVHEQILPAVRATDGEVRWADVTITHVGYADPAARRRKLDRDLRLLAVEDREHPDDPFTLFNLGSVYVELGRPADAVALLQRSLDRSNPKDSIVRKLYALIAQCQRQMGKLADSLATCRRGREVYPDDAELLFVESVVRREMRDFAGAEASLLKLLEGRDGEHFASVAEGLRGHKARHNLAMLYLDTSRDREAEAEWGRVVADQPTFLPARAGLSEVYLRQKRWDDLERQAQALESLGPAGDAEAEALRGRGKLERGEFASARWALGLAVRRFPEAIHLRVLLSHAALKEGADDAAEEALLGVLQLDPGHPEARQNLAVLRARRRLKPGEEITLTALFRSACEAGGGQSSSLTALADLARKCHHVTHVGPGRGRAPTAVMYAQPAKFNYYGPTRDPDLDLLEALARRTSFQFHTVAEPPAAIEPTDLLVVEGLPPEAARQIVERHCARVNQFIALIDFNGDTRPESPTYGSRYDGLARELEASGRFRIASRPADDGFFSILELNRSSS